MGQPTLSPVPALDFRMAIQALPKASAAFTFRMNSTEHIFSKSLRALRRRTLLVRNDATGNVDDHCDLPQSLDSDGHIRIQPFKEISNLIEKSPVFPFVPELANALKVERPHEAFFNFVV
jgi:hypothetical protein